MENLHFKAITTVMIDSKPIVVNTMKEMWEELNIPDTPEYTDARTAIVQKLLAFREIDLSQAYRGHSVHVYLRFEDEDDA